MKRLLLNVFIVFLVHCFWVGVWFSSALTKSYSKSDDWYWAGILVFQYVFLPVLVLSILISGLSLISPGGSLDSFIKKFSKIFLWLGVATITLIFIGWYFELYGIRVFRHIDELKKAWN